MFMLIWLTYYKFKQILILGHHKGLPDRCSTYLQSLNVYDKCSLAFFLKVLIFTGHDVMAACISEESSLSGFSSQCLNHQGSFVIAGN